MIYSSPAHSYSSPAHGCSSPVYGGYIFLHAGTCTQWIVCISSWMRWCCLCCSILGLRSDASSDDIKKYYRKQAVLVHPDKVGGSFVHNFKSIVLETALLVFLRSLQVVCLFSSAESTAWCWRSFQNTWACIWFDWWSGKHETKKYCFLHWSLWFTTDLLHANDNNGRFDGLMPKKSMCVPGQTKFLWCTEIWGWRGSGGHGRTWRDGHVTEKVCRHNAERQYFLL